MREHPVEQWHHIVQRRDPADLESFLAADVVFHSPVVHKPVQGRPMASRYLAAAFEVFFNDSFRYVRQIVGANDAMLEFEVTIDGVLVNGVDIIGWNAAGEVNSFKVMIRPLKAINLVHQLMAGKLN